MVTARVGGYSPWGTSVMEYVLLPVTEDHDHFRLLEVFQDETRNWEELRSDQRGLSVTGGTLLPR